MPKPAVDERTLWRLLGEPRRHAVLRHLAEARGVTTTADVVESVLERCDGDGDLLRLELRHVDLPMLADADVVSYDPERDLIYPTDRVGALCEALDAVEASLESPTKA